MRFILLVLSILTFSSSAFAEDRVPYTDAPSTGGSGTITMVMFENFRCPHTKKSQQTMREIQRKYPDIRFVHRSFPLGAQDAARASEAAFAAERFGKFWEYHSRLFETQAMWKAMTANEFENHLIKIASDLGIDRLQFAKVLNSSDVRDRVVTERKFSERADVRGTPTFFLNGRRLAGTLPLEKFEREIALERAALGKLKSSKARSYDARVKANFTLSRTTLRQQAGQK